MAKKHKKKKGKGRAAVVGLVTGLATAATDAVSAAGRKLGIDAQSGGGTPADRADEAEETTDLSAAKKDGRGKKDGGKDKRGKDKGGKRKKQKGKDEKRLAVAVADYGIRAVVELADAASKRLSKIAKKRGVGRAKRKALLAELSTLQKGIAAALLRIVSDDDKTSGSRA